MSHCSQCGVEFSCGMVDAVSTARCWCSALPTAPAKEVRRDANGAPRTCMCADCLSILRARRLAD